MKYVKKLIPLFVLTLVFSGCVFEHEIDTGNLYNQYARQVGEEIPPSNITGKTYDKAEQLTPGTQTSRVLTGLGWFLSILSGIAK